MKTKSYAQHGFFVGPPPFDADASDEDFILGEAQARRLMLCYISLELLRMRASRVMLAWALASLS